MRMLSLSVLGLGDDVFIDIYHEILKHELCLMRLGDLCFNLNGYYVSRSRQSVVHNVDVKMTMLDIVYAVLNSSNLRSGYKFDARDFDEFIRKLVESRLLVDLPCGDRERELVLNALNQAPLIEAGLGDNPFIYYYMTNELRSRLRENFGEIEEYLRANVGKCFKTAYGELIRLFRYEVALPHSAFDMPYRVLESYVLPFIEEYLPLRSPERLNEVCKKLMDLHGDVGKAICNGLREMGINGLDNYQAKMIGSMIENINFNAPKIAVISAPTGSGKTLIFMTYVILKLLRRGGVAVIIYPTKALAREQLEFMLNLLYSINAGLGKKVHAYIIDGDSPHSTEALRSKPFRGGIKIRGGELYYDEKGLIKLVKDRSTEKIDWVSEVRPSKIEEPAVVITNHAMLSLHLNKGSQWVKDLLTRLNTIIIDEAHVYMHDIELLNVLHFLLTRLFVAALVNNALSEGRDINDLAILEGIKELIRERGIDLILSSATLGDRRVIEEGIAISQLGGVNLAAIRNNQMPNLRPLLKWLLEIYGEDGLIYVPYYDVITTGNVRRRLVIAVVNFPVPSESAQTPFIEGLVSAIIWTEALSNGLRRTYNTDSELHALAFIDNKLTQREVFTRLIHRGIRHEALHADKLLISPLMNISTYGKRVLEDALRNTEDPLRDAYLSTYSHLQLFYEYDVLRKYMRLYRENKASIKELRDLVRDAFNFAESIRNASVSGGIKFVNEGDGVHYVMIHNADLEVHERSYVENILRNGKWRLVIATSTLELGVNIPSVALVIQYGSPPSSESFIQRIGRAGRDNNSLRVSFGTLFMKNVGKDISYIDETQAFKSLFNLEQPRFSEKPDRETLIRFMGLLYRDLSASLGKGSVKAVLERTLVELYGIKDNEAKDMVNETLKLVNNYEEVRKILNTSISEGRGLHDFKVLITHVKDDLSNAYTKLRSALESARSSLKNTSNKALKALLDDIENLAENKVLNLYNNIDSALISRLITTELTRIIHELKSISTSINDLNNRIKAVVGTSLNYKHGLRYAVNKLDESRKNIDDAYNNLLSLLSITTMINDKLSKPSVKERLINAITDLILGNRLPNPAVSEGVTSFILTCGNASLEGGNAKLNNCKLRDSSRDDVLRTLPFKYYE